MEQAMPRAMLSGEKESHRLKDAQFNAYPAGSGCLDSLPHAALPTDHRSGYKAGVRISLSARKSAWLLLIVSLALLFLSRLLPRDIRGFLLPQTLTISSSAPPYDFLASPIDDAQSRHGRTKDVQWDKHSLIIKGRRIFLHSGEFHTFRLPVPDLWLDILQKMKAAGLNGVSLYTHMGLINPSRGVIDLDGFRALQPFFDACRDLGLWVVLRPGPYINAETTAGGIAHWITSEVTGMLRTNATDFHEAWKPYIGAIINATVQNQVSRGGPVIAIQIDNEYTQYGLGEAAAQYFVQLEEAYHDSEIVVPLTYNDPGQLKNFVNGTGASDIYGLDAYPQRFDCSKPETWNPVTANYHDYHQDTNPSQPFYSPEFQAGAFDPWGPNAPGYDACRSMTGPDFESVFYLSLWAANAKLINYYMVYGGTSWGAIPFPGVYTSYDYGSAIKETRQLTDKYSELKRQGLFLRSSPEFYKTDWVGNSSTGVMAVSNPSAFVVHLKNPDTNASFYVVRQSNSSSIETISFHLDVNTLAGRLELPQVVSTITLSGRQSKMIVSDYSFGSSTVLYSTASILFAGKIGSRDVLYLHGDLRHEHEFSMAFRGAPSHLMPLMKPGIHFHSSPAKTVHAQQTVVSILVGVEGLVTLWDSDEQLVLFSDTDTAGTFWAPEIPGSQSDLSNYWGFGTNSSVLIGGPYLVRSANITDNRLELRGDLEKDVRLFLFAPSTVNYVTWNGIPIAPDLSFTAQGGFGIELSSRISLLASPISLPRLSGWKYANSLPEIQTNFSDADWTTANHISTNIPYPPHYGDGAVLYGCDYGFCESAVIWRGHFAATGAERSVNLSVNGGEAFAASVWLNDVFLKTTYGNSSNNENIVGETDELYIFPEGSVVPGQDNVITILQDNMGLEETDGYTPDTSKSPRGIRGFQLNNGSFSSWKVQGKVGGYLNFPDRVRGIFNEGGLFGERAGWHLPGFDVSSWTTRELSDSLPGDNSGVGFFVTTFELHIPEGYDVPISFVFDAEQQPYRAQLFVNGWNFGKRVANLGPQYRFPVPEGILNYNGENTVAVALWVMENEHVVPMLSLEIDGLYDGGVGKIQSNNPRWESEGRV